jgi:hypothetical protein
MTDTLRCVAVLVDCDNAVPGVGGTRASPRTLSDEGLTL